MCHFSHIHLVVDDDLDELLEVALSNVSGYQIQDKPVANGRSLHDLGQFPSVDHATSTVCHRYSELQEDDRQQSIDDRQHADHGDKVKPKPQEDVDLLIDDVGLKQ